MDTRQSTPCGEEPRLSIVLDEYDQNRRAVVRLHWHEATIVGRGLSRLVAFDEAELPIGQKLALARALSDLVRQLFTDAALDMETVSTLRSA